MAEKKWTKELEAKIIARAWKDERFKKLLISNPHEAFKEFGIEFKGKGAFNVLEETPNQSYLIIPLSPTQAKDLSETELEQIAAAKIPYSTECVGNILDI